MVLARALALARPRVLSSTTPMFTSKSVTLCSQVYPRSEFEAATKKMWKYGLIEMALEHPFALASDEVMQPVLADPERFRRHCHEDRTETCIKMFYDDPFFRYRFTETMERLIDGYILNAA